MSLGIEADVRVNSDRITGDLAGMLVFVEGLRTCHTCLSSKPHTHLPGARQPRATLKGVSTPIHGAWGSQTLSPVGMSKGPHRSSWYSQQQSQ